jgi:polysaccharide export outer membrane protein
MPSSQHSGVERRFLRSLNSALAVVLLLSLGACSSLGASGPETGKVRRASDKSVGTANIQIIPVTDDVARRVLASSRAALFSEALGEDVAPEWTVIGRGDTLQVSIWEAPPAVLFGSTATFGANTGGMNALAGAVAQQNSIPEMMVDDQGMIQIPFAGAVRAAGQSPRRLPL